jgi:hypothetical protein
LNCKVWRQDPTWNPIQKTKIRRNSLEYKYYLEKCGSPVR